MSPELVVMFPEIEIFRAERLIEPEPSVERLVFALTVILLAVLFAISIRLRFARRVMFDVTTIWPVVLLPIVSRLAVIWLHSVNVRPRLAELSDPPRFTPVPSVWISTFPAEVAFTVPVSTKLLTVSVIRPPLEAIFEVESLNIKPKPVLLLGVLPVTTKLPKPEVDKLPEFHKNTPIDDDDVP